MRAFPGLLTEGFYAKKFGETRGGMNLGAKKSEVFALTWNTRRKQGGHRKGYGGVEELRETRQISSTYRRVR